MKLPANSVHPKQAFLTTINVSRLVYNPACSRERGGENMQFKHKLAGAIATTALMANLFAPIAYADTDITISGNGNGSNNSVNLTTNDSTNVSQTNNQTVNLIINSTASSGNNQANNNTGGNVSINTGNATSNVSVNITGGSNSAILPLCGCNSTDTVNISGNGSNSNNTVKVTHKRPLNVNQTTDSWIDAFIYQKAKSGRNRANNNTNGTVNVTTGNASATSNVSVSSPSNTLNLTP